MYTEKGVFDAIVIGGGAAGMMAAGRAASLGAKVLLIEKNKTLGKKLSISGGGRCNITNAENDTRELLSHYGKAQDYLFSSFSQFGVEDTFSFFEERGLPLVVEARKRTFPQTQSALDVVRVMEDYVRSSAVEIHLSTKVAEIRKQEDGLFVVTTKKGKVFYSKSVVVAAGGTAAPQTGSTGDGFSIAQNLGHTIKEPNPNIVPLTTNATWVHDLSGISLSFMKLSFLQNEKVQIKKVGKVLFTHFGISGPLVLNAAHDVKELLAYGPVEASIDLFPDTDHGALSKRILNLFDKHKNKILKNILNELLPQQIAHSILMQVELSEREAHSITKEERSLLVHTMKDLRFPITGTLGFDKAVIADGGVLIDEIDMKHMESNICPNLFLIGDTLHINRPSGGYSLQLSWTTGYVAGSSIAKRFVNNDIDA